jgi:hypothetical protein
MFVRALDGAEERTNGPSRPVTCETLGRMMNANPSSFSDFGETEGRERRFSELCSNELLNSTLSLSRRAARPWV